MLRKGNVVHESLGDIVFDIWRYRVEVRCVEKFGGVKYLYNPRLGQQRQRQTFPEVQSLLHFWYKFIESLNIWSIVANKDAQIFHILVGPDNSPGLFRVDVLIGIVCSVLPFSNPETNGFFKIYFCPSRFFVVL